METLNKNNMEMKIYSKMITPQDAKKMLAKNTLNRKLNEKWVSFYFQQMLNGNWMQTGDTIKFAPDGTLLDGQHRLNAIVKFDKPVLVTIAENIDKKAFQILDTGKSRSAGDTVAIKGYKNPNNLAAAARAVLLFQLGYYSQDYGSGKKALANNQKVLEFIEKNKEFGEMVYYCRTIFNKFRVLSQSTLVMLYYVLSKKDQVKCDTFFEKFATGIDLGETSPIRVLRDRYLKDMTHKTKLTSRDKVALFIKAWNAYRMNKKVTNLMLEKDYKFPTAI